MEGRPFLPSSCSQPPVSYLQGNMDAVLDILLSLRRQDVFPFVLENQLLHALSDRVIVPPLLMLHRSVHCLSLGCVYSTRRCNCCVIMHGSWRVSWRSMRSGLCHFWWNIAMTFPHKTLSRHYSLRQSQRSATACYIRIFLMTISGSTGSSPVKAKDLATPY
jgi:hypothetical protein